MNVDQSFCSKTLERVLRKSDFDHRIPEELRASLRALHISDAVSSADTSFQKPSNPLGKFPLKGKQIYRFVRLSDELVARKLCENLKLLLRKSYRGRAQIVECLELLLQEGVPFRVYRLDIKGFYESFDSNFVRTSIQRLVHLSPHSKTLLLSLLESHISIGGTGVPRGLSLGAVLSEIFMRPFDIQVIEAPHVYFYARYVDDIVAITSGRETQDDFLDWLRQKLPKGLILNSWKEQIRTVPRRVSPIKPAMSALELLKFDYLGYEFAVSEPVHDSKIKQAGGHFRQVTIDISEKKVKKIKTRMVRAFVDYLKSRDWALLRDRLKFLRQNYYVRDPKMGGKKLAGIYHSYPQISGEAKALRELDQFLRNAVLSRKGRVFSELAIRLNGRQKRELLSQSFASGHSGKTFVYFSGDRIHELQKCWKY